MIKIILIDDATDVVVGESDIDEDSLPDSFVDDTILHIGDQDWSVAEAEPLTREEYLKSRQVVLRLRRVEHKDASKILFTLPTICEPIPTTQGPLLEGRELLLHEDDWRQIELISRSLEPVIDEEIPQIAEILSGSRTDAGFRDIHVRKRIEEPLQGVGLTLDGLRGSLGESKATESRVVLPDSSNCVTNSFSFFLAQNLVLYGLSEADTVTVLAFTHSERGPKTPRANPQVLKKLATEFDLLAVDWCRALKAGADESAFESLLDG